MKTLFKSKKSYKRDLVIITAPGDAQYLYVRDNNSDALTLVGLVIEKTRKGWRYTDPLLNENFESSANYEKGVIVD